MDIDKSFSWTATRDVRNNNPLLPRSIRGLIVGKSNCGKTTLLLNLLLRDGWLDYNRLYVFGKSLHQSEYVILKKGFAAELTKAQLTNLFKNQDEVKRLNTTPEIIIEQYIKGHCNDEQLKIKGDFFTDSSLIPDPSELDVNKKNLLVMDDCLLERQNKAEAYYTRGRHNNCDSFYISQNYFRLPRQTIRENANFIILFPQDMKNLNHIFADHCSADMNIKEFKAFCKISWEAKPHNFIVIDLSSSKYNGKYRCNLDTFYFPENL